MDIFINQMEIFFTKSHPVIMGLAIFVLVFLIFREVILWYWRINENTESLQRIADSLEVIAAATDFLASDIDQKNSKKISPKIQTAKVADTKEAKRA
jgi:CHASE3 domain sensor protein